MGDKTTNDRDVLCFVFLGWERDWEHVLGLEDSEQPQGRVFVYRALPGNVVAWGNTRDEAVVRLRDAVEVAMTESATPEDWYREAACQLTEEDLKEQLRVFGEVWKGRGVKCKELLFADRPGVVFDAPPVLRSTRQNRTRDNSETTTA